MNENNAILVLDDDPDILNLLQLELEKEGYQVHRATNVDEALKQLGTHEYLCAVVDIVLGPNMTSDQVIHHITNKEDSLSYQIPMIVISSYMNRDYADKIESKPNVFKALPKPLKKGQITSAINTLVEQFSLDNDPNLDKELFQSDLLHPEEAAKAEKESVENIYKNDIQYKNESGETSLHIFSRRGEINVVNDLIKKGADINAQRNDGKTSLHLAILNDQFPIVSRLIEKGAKIDVPDKQGKTPLYDAITCGDYSSVDLLIAKKAPINAKSKSGDTYLMLALESNKLSIFNRLLAAGLDPKVKNKKGDTVFDIARKKQAREFQKILNSMKF